MGWWVVVVGGGLECSGGGSSTARTSWRRLLTCVHPHPSAQAKAVVRPYTPVSTPDVRGVMDLIVKVGGVGSGGRGGRPCSRH